MVFVFKQKTAYEVRISDWSSDVCSSDLHGLTRSCRTEFRQDEALTTARLQEVVVVGAGVVGIATALTLADRGHRVTVIDRAREPGRGASFANGAQLSYAYTDALASPATLAQLQRLDRKSTRLNSRH